MGIKTGIAWTESTLNLAVGCTKVSVECKNCYMYRDATRFKFDPYHIKLTKAGSSDEVMRKAIKERGNLIFVNSWSDTFHKSITVDVLDRWFKIFAEFPDKQFQILTKRPEKASWYFMNRRNGEVPDNCWIGTSIGIQSSILTRLTWLHTISAKIRFVSFEPLLEDLGDIDLKGVQWAIIGGESDFKNPRPMKPEWAENIVNQCKRDGVAVFFKQMGGKGSGGAGGDLLNGREIKEYPELLMTI